MLLQNLAAYVNETPVGLFLPWKTHAMPPACVPEQGGNDSTNL